MDRLTRRRAAKRKYSNKRNAWKRQFIARAKQRPCADCGVSYPHYMMDFDHVTLPKLFVIGNSYVSRSLEEVANEIEKCDVVCANCHRARTWTRKNGDQTNLNLIE